MPENDLGTAEGRIRIGYDDRGTDKALLALAKLEKQFQAINNRLGKIEKALNTADAAFEKSADSMDRASKSTKGFTSSIFGAHKAVTGFGRDVRSLYEDLNKLNDALGRMKDASKPFALGYRTIDHFAQSVANGNNKVLSFGKALGTAGVASAIFNKQVVQNLIGVKAAMAEMPRWSQNVYQFSNYLTKAGAASLVMYKTLSPAVIHKYLDAFRNLGPIQKMLNEHDRLNNAYKSMSNQLIKMPNAIHKGIAPISDFANATRKFTSGLALVNSGVKDVIARFQWLARIPAPIKYAFNTTIAQVLPAALMVLGKALTSVSNLAAGLWDGVKQLSGGMLALPGVFATIGAAVAPLAIIFGGLGKKLKDVFGDDPVKAAEAYYKLPQALRPAVDAIKGFSEQASKMRENLQNIFFAGFDKQITQLGNSYLPLLERGMTGVTLALRGMKDQLVGFLLAAQTQKDVNTLYGTTASTLMNVSRSLRPALDGLRNIGIVGAQFVTEMTAGMPRVVNQFAKWAETNRNNGNLIKWMRGAREGVNDLVRGSLNLTKALYSVLTMFQTGPQTNWLQSFASSMERFNVAVQKSAGSGALRKIGDEVRSLALLKIDNLKSTWGAVKDFLESMLPIINTIAKEFSGPFIFALKGALEEFSLVAQAIHSLGLDQMIGLIWGVRAGWSAFSNLMVPLAAKLKIVYGSFLVLNNATKVINGVEGAVVSMAAKLEKIPGIGSKIASSMVNVATSTGGALAKLAAVAPQIAAVAAVLGSVFFVWRKGTDEADRFHNQIAQNDAQIKQFGGSLRTAFKDDGSLVGHSVMDAVGKGVDDMLVKLDETKKAGPGVMSHLKDFFISNHGFNFNDSDQTNQFQKIKDDSGHAAEQIRQLRDSGTDLNAVLTGSDAGFSKFIDNLNATGRSPAAAELQKLRDQFKGAENEAKLLGVGGEQAAQGLDKLARAGGNAATKLDGLKLELQGLGLLKVSTIEAVAQYNSAIDGMIDKVQEAIDSGDGLDNLWDKQNNTLNTNTKTGQNLASVFGNISEEFLTLASSGGNVDEAMARINGKMDELSEKTGIDKSKLQQFFSTQLGVNPVVKALVQLDGKPELVKDFTGFLAHLSAMAQTHKPFVPIQFGTEDAAKQFSEFVNKTLGKDLTANNGNLLVLKPGVQLSPEDMAKLQTQLTQFGIQTGATPGAPSQIAPAPTGPVAGTPPVQVSQTPAVPTPPIPYMPQTPLPSVAPLDQPDNATPEQTLPDKLPREIDTDEAQKSAIDTSQDVVDTATEILTSGGAAAGDKFVEALAGGIGTSSAADKATEKLADSLIENFHQSPPKKGPLSKHGDAANYAGKQFVSAYSTGMKGQAATAADAAAAIGSAAAGGVSGVASGQGGGIQQTGKFLGELSRLSEFMSHVVNAFRSSFDSVTGLLKWASDPGKKGTFFGMTPGEAFGFTAQYAPETAQKKYQDKMAQLGMSTANSATRDLSQMDQYGLNKIQGPGVLQRDAKDTDVVAAIVAEGQKRGWSPDQINAAVTTANLESNFNPTAGGDIHKGLFAQGVTGKGGGDWGTVEQVTDPNYAIQKFADAFDKVSPPGTKGADAAKQQALIAQGAQTDPGWLPAYQNRYADSVKRVQEALKNPGSLVPGARGIGTPFSPVNGTYGLPPDTTIGSVGSKGLAEGFPQWVYDLGAPFGLKPSTYGGHQTTTGIDGGPQNNPDQLNRGIDWSPIEGGQMYPGKDGYTAAQRERLTAFAQMLVQSGQAEQVIWDDPVTGQKIGFPLTTNYDGDWKDHQGHVHTRFNRPVILNGGVQGSPFGPPNIVGTPGYNPQSGPGAKMQVGPDGTLVPISTPTDDQRLPENLRPQTRINANGDLEIWSNDNKTLIDTVPRNMGDGSRQITDAEGHVLGFAKQGKPGEAPFLTPPEGWNVQTGAPYTEEEKKQFAAQNPLQYQFDPNTPPEDLEFLRTHPEYLRSKKEVEDGMKAATPGLAEAMQQAYMGSQADRALVLQRLSGMKGQYDKQDTVFARQQSALIGSTISEASEQAGLQVGANPIDAAASAASAISGSVQSIFSTIDSFIESAGAAKDLTDMAVRGMSNTEDVNKAIDDVQKFIELGANIAGTVANISGAAASIASAVGSSNPMGGSGGASAALEGVSAIAGGIQATLQTINGIIDLAQEAYHIWGSYYGQFEGLLAGGPNGMLVGNVKYLLDEQSKQLLAYSADNPADKRAHDFAFQTANPNVRNQLAGNIIVYGGPGSDPRDDTRQMMFQVRQATMGQAVNSG